MATPDAIVLARLRTEKEIAHMFLYDDHIKIKYRKYECSYRPVDGVSMERFAELFITDLCDWGYRIASDKSMKGDGKTEEKNTKKQPEYRTTKAKT